MKNLSSFTKTLIMMVVSLIASTISEGGIPSSKSAWIVFGITVGSTVITYISKNAAFPSISLWGELDLRDLISAVILAIGTGTGNWAAQLATSGTIDWKAFATAIISVVVGYFAKTFVSFSTIKK